MNGAGIRWADFRLDGILPGFPAAVGGTLSADILLDAYRHGFFPLPTLDPDRIEIFELAYGAQVATGRVVLLETPAGASPYTLPWWHPPARPVIPAGGVRLPSYLRQQLRNRFSWTTTADTAFDRVVDECGRDRRRWLVRPLIEALSELHGRGWAHSVEVWSGSELIGGVFGIGIGTVFSMESTFHRLPGAGKVAFADLDRRLSDTAAVLLDAQLPSAHMTALGARDITRDEYLRELGRRSEPLVPALGERAARWPGRQPQGDVRSR